MPLITVETASEMGKRSAAARKLAAEQSLIPLPNGRNHAQALERLERQLASLDDAIDAGELTPADWRDLTQARQRLFQQWQVLANIPNPGNLRPKSRPGGRAPAAEAEPTPQ